MHRRLRVALLLVACACGGCALPAVGSPAELRVKRVAGGHKVGIAAVPYQVRIDVPEGMCGGTIIHPSFVLTAKHCVKAKAGLKRTLVWAGGPSAVGRPEVSRHVLRAVAFPDKARAEQRRRWLPHGVHPNAVAGDIALLQVYPPFPTDRVAEIRPVRLQTKQGYEGSDCIVSGWGSTSVNDSAPARLRLAFAEVFPREQCLRLERRLKRDFLCAGRRGGGGGVDACYGDSGGPLLCGGLLTGVVKGGRGCGESHQVTKYTEVALFASWVAHVVGIEEHRLGAAWKDA